MKKILLFACLGFPILLTTTSGCKKKIATPAHTGNYDSTYTLTGDQIAGLKADPHNALAEIFNGQSCNNCPAAHYELATKLTGISDRVNIVNIYFFGLPQSIPPSGSTYDLRLTKGSEIARDIYGGINALPSGGIDRKQSATDMIITDRSLWSGNIDAQLNVIDSVNLSVKSTYNAADLTYNIVATVTYTNTVATKQNLTVLITEDSIADIQTFPTSAANYVFDHVLRDMVSSNDGDPILSTASTKTKGMVIERHFIYKLPTVTPAIIPKNCHVVAFANNTSGDNRAILQSAQTALIQ